MPRQVPVTFDVAQFDKAVEDMGLPAIYEQAVICDCINVETKQPDFNCKKCGGMGVQYLPPVAIKAVVSSMGGQHDIFKSFGITASGTAYATTSSRVILGWHDRLTFPDIKSKYSENLTMNGVTSSRARKPILSALAVIKDSVVYEPGKDFVIVKNDVTQSPDLPVVPYTVDDRPDRTEYRISWVNPDTCPPSGSRVSILYYTPPRYIVENMAHELRASISVVKSPVPRVVELPKQAFLKREDFMFDLKGAVEVTENSIPPEPSDGLGEW